MTLIICREIRVQVFFNGSLNVLYSQFQHSFTALQWGKKCETEREQVFPTEPGEEGGSRYFPAACGEDCGGADTHTAVHGEPHTGTGGHDPKEAASMESPQRSRVLEGAVGLDMKTTLEQVYPEGQQPWVKTQAGTGRSVRWKKWQRGTGMDWLQLPFSSHCTAQWGYGMEEVEELGKEKWSWDWKKVVGESYFSVLFCLCFTAFNSILLIY